MALMSVDLPAAFGPTRAVIRPRPTARSTPFSAVRRPNRFTNPRTMTEGDSSPLAGLQAGTDSRATGPTAVMATTASAAGGPPAPRGSTLAAPVRPHRAGRRRDSGAGSASARFAEPAVRRGAPDGT